MVSARYRLPDLERLFAIGDDGRVTGTYRDIVIHKGYVADPDTAESIKVFNTMLHDQLEVSEVHGIAFDRRSTILMSRTGYRWNLAPEYLVETQESLGNAVDKVRISAPVDRQQALYSLGERIRRGHSPSPADAIPQPRELTETREGLQILEKAEPWDLHFVWEPAAHCA